MGLLFRVLRFEGILFRGPPVQRCLLFMGLLFRGPPVRMPPVQRASFSEGFRSRKPPVQKVSCSEGLRSTRPTQRCRLFIGPPVKVPPFRKDLFRGPPVQGAACLAGLEILFDDRGVQLKRGPNQRGPVRIRGPHTVWNLMAVTPFYIKICDDRRNASAVRLHLIRG